MELTKAINKAYVDYKADNPCSTEFMEMDFKAGFRRGYEAAESSNGLRERAAMAAMQGILAHGTATCSVEFVAGKSVALADALIARLNKPRQS